MRFRVFAFLFLASSACGRIGFALQDDARENDAQRGPRDGGEKGGPHADADVSEAGSGSTSDGATPVAMLPDPGPKGPDTTFSTSANLSWQNTNGRSCPDGGDMVSYSVTELMDARAVLSTSPGPGCLNAGDEVLVVSVQGTQGAHANVGHLEFLTVDSVAGSEVRFTANKVNAYGAGEDDSFLGTSRTQQRVLLQRVPRYGDVSIESNATISAYAWDGVHGGVFAMRVVGELRLDGTIDMTGAGFAGGPPTDPVSTTGQQGESIAGLGVQSTTANLGGGGGGLGDGMGCREDGSPGGGAGHAIAGSSATVATCGGVGGGSPGAMVSDPSLFLLGSGGGAGGTDNTRIDNPPGGKGGEGGGAIFLYATNIVGTGSILARGHDGQGDAPGLECSGTSVSSCWDHAGAGGGGAGGTLWLVTNSVQNSVRIDLSGGLGGNGNNTWAGDGGNGANGRMMRYP